jgi:hypothetical protein
MKNMVATSWSRDKEKEDGSKEEVEDPQSDALPNQSTGRPTSFHHNVEPRRQCFEKHSYAT